jgi:hypothetical protein
MLFWSLKISIISIILIFLVHHLILFFKGTLTVPKIKDLVNAPQRKYEDIYNILSKAEYNSNTGNNFNAINTLNTLNDDEKQETKLEINTMKNELKSFLKKQLNSDSSNTTSIETLDSFSNSKNNFSMY